MMKTPIAQTMAMAALCTLCICAISCGGGSTSQSSATTDTSKTTTAPAPATVILDEDLGSSTDDLLAMTMLYDAHRQGKVNFKALMINREGLEYLQLADIMNTYYGFADMPIGKTHHAPKNPPVFIPYWQMAKPEEYKEMPKFKRTYTDEQLQQLPDAEILYRKILAQEPDSSVIIFSIGFPTNIAHLLETKADQLSPLNGVELVAKKVKAMYIMGGEIAPNDTPEPEYNLKQDPENALVMINQWPSKIYFSPGATGHKIDYTPAQVIADQNKMNLQDSPLCKIYQLFDCNTGQRMWDACAVQQYLCPSLYQMHGPVKYTVDSDMILHEQPGKLHYMTYTTTAEQDTAILKHIRQTSHGGLRQ
ncbi:MAG: nucleoside hydrolase [Bacteroidales bacterium]|nr:nucleoside hydrolase [Bacteroidales bacterium]